MSAFDQPNPDDGLSDQKPSLILSGRQLVVYDLLAHYMDGELAKIYKGALEVLDSRISDYEALAAHGFREVIKIAWRRLDERDPQGIKDKFHGLLKQPWETLLSSEKDGVFQFEATQRFVEAFQGFQQWINDERPSSHTQTESTLKHFQKSRKSPESFERDHKNLMQLYQKLCGIAHHPSKKLSYTLAELVDQLEDLLLRYLRPSEAVKLKEIQEQVNAVGDNPTAAHLTTIEKLIDGWADRTAFLDAIKNAEWVDILFEAEWFDGNSDKGPHPAAPNPGLSEAVMLFRLSATNPISVQRAALQLAVTATPLAQGILLDIATTLPKELATDFIVFAVQWIPVSRGYVSYTAIQGFISSILSGGLTAEGLNLIATTLRFYPDPNFDKKSQERKSDGKHPLFVSLESDPTWEDYQYKSIIENISQCVLSADRIMLLNALTEVLSDGIDFSIWPEEKIERKGDDASEIWRPAIEPSDQNQDYGHREQLVTGIRDLAENILKENSAKWHEIETLLDSYPWLIFKRLKLHLIRTFPAVAGDSVRRALLDGTRPGVSKCHEWTLLLQEQFKNSSPETQELILNWIETGFNPQWRINYYKSNHADQSPEDSEIDQWRRRWQFERLWLIANVLPPEWKLTFDGMKAEFDPPEHAEFRYWSSGVREVKSTSPISSKKILTLSPEELLTEIQNLPPLQPYEGMSAGWGLLGALKSASKQDPQYFLQKISTYRSLAPAHYLAILDGIFESENAGNLSLLLEESEWAIQEVLLKPNGSDDSGLGIEMARALEKIAKNGVKLPSENQVALFRCMKSLLDHPNPEKDSKKKISPGDLSFTSLNTTRLITTRALFEFDISLHQTESKVTRGNLSDEILLALEERLKLEPTLAGRGIFGERLGWLLHKHQAWVESHLKDLFPVEPEQKDQRDAVWNCFVTMQGASNVALEVLDKEYRRAIRECAFAQAPDKKSGHWLPDEGLVNHLAAYYWWGNLVLPNQEETQENLLGLFYRNAPTRLRRYLLNFIGRSMHNTKEEVPPEIKQHFQDLMEWRLSVLEQTDNGSEDRTELGGFSTWVDSQKLDPKWTIETLKRALALHPKMEGGHDFMFIKPLAKYSADFSGLAMECLRMIVFAEDSTPYWWSMDEEIKTILRNARSSPQKAIQEQGEEVQDHLLRLGRLQFQDLGSDK